MNKVSDITITREGVGTHRLYTVRGCFWDRGELVQDEPLSTHRSLDEAATAARAIAGRKATVVATTTPAFESEPARWTVA